MANSDDQGLRCADDGRHASNNEGYGAAQQNEEDRANNGAPSVADSTTVLIVDDHPLFRDALTMALERAVSGVKIRHSGSIAAAQEVLAEGPVDLILLDLSLSDASGFDGLAKITALPGAPKVAVVSATETGTAFDQAKTLGAVGYLPKSLALQDLSDALSQILTGTEVFPEAGADSSSANEALAKVAALTPAQRRVLEGVSGGLLNKQIAYEMGISDATVKAHMTAIMRKLGATNRTQALLIYKEALSVDGHSAA